MSPPPLTKRRKDGTLYVRPPEFEKCIIELEPLTLDERTSRFQLLKEDPEYVPSEVVLHFMRRAWTEGAKDVFAQVYRMLIKRVESSLLSSIRDVQISNASDVRDEVRNRFIEKLVKDCNEGEAMDYFEVRFNSALVALRTDVLRKIGPMRAEMGPLASISEDGHGYAISPEVEAAAAEFMSGWPSIFDDPIFRLELQAAIRNLPADQKQVFELWIDGVPIGSKDKKTKNIADILHCTERTVQNRRDRAIEALKAVFRKGSLK